jgi:uncharacterized membrane protein YedE/YeeE
MKNLNFFLIGFIFAIGLGISGMTNPEKIKSFLDFFGKWDPALGFVMLGAIGFHFLSYRFITKRTSPLFEDKWHIPANREITLSLIFGSVLFGVGWGLGGFCPGPAVASLASFKIQPLVFVLSMLLSMFFIKKWQSNKK